MEEPTRSPDVVVFEHDHTAQIVPVRIHSANHHPVFLNESESRCRLSRAGDHAMPVRRASKVPKPPRAAREPLHR